jgi:hypothetical protein
MTDIPEKRDDEYSKSTRSVPTYMSKKPGGLFSTSSLKCEYNKFEHCTPYAWHNHQNPHTPISNGARLWQNQ